MPGFGCATLRRNRHALKFNRKFRKWPMTCLPSKKSFWNPWPFFYAIRQIYMALLGKDSGPQAGWFLEAVDRRFLIDRFLEVVALPKREKAQMEDLATPLIVIHKEVRERFPVLKLRF